MNLIVDVGNTNTKVAVFDQDQLMWSQIVKPNTLLDQLHKLQNQFPIADALLASVGKENKDWFSFLDEQYATIRLDHTTKLPFENQYQTPQTLGVDRIGLVAAFAKAYPQKNGLIIDAGTCITYDFINAEGQYQGGAITPGLQLRYKALNQHTARLPLLNPRLIPSLIGNSTENSIHAGVSGGILREIEGTVLAYKEQFPDLITVLTGGDAALLSEQLKNGIFAHSNFLLQGLNYILEFNKNE
ncbi:type III pantothenate kinase [Croceiramulus getboli]|nr:type III pantothenate kinase [Flavobacteriaceae bacterium YJPT1-3]